MRSRHERPFEFRKRRPFIGRTHIGPDRSAAFHAGVGLELDLAAEAALGRLRGNVNALPVHIVLPAVVGAAQAAFLTAPEPERGAAVRAELVEQCHAPVRVTEGDQRLREQLHPHRRAVRLGQFLGKQRRDPVASEQPAHQLARAGARQQLVCLLTSWHDN